MIERERTLTTKKTPWPRGGPRCSVRALPEPASQSIYDRLHHDKCHAVSRPRLFRTPHCCTSPPAPNATGCGNLEKAALWQFGESSVPSIVQNSAIFLCPLLRFLHCRWLTWLAEFACTKPRIGNVKTSLSGSAIKTSAS